MNEPFVPLFPGAGSEPGSSTQPCHARILPSPSGQKTEALGFVPAGSPQCPVAHRPPAGPAGAEAAPGKPVVTLVRDGEHVSRIHIVCGCGAVIDLDCAY